MEIDELKELWTQSNRKLEASMRLDTLLLQQGNFRKADSSLKQLSGGIAFELAVNFIGILLLGSFAANHFYQARFLIPAVALGVYAVALLVAGIRQLVEINGVDYDEPVVAIQKKLQQLRVRRIWATIGTLLFAPLMWVPFSIVVSRGLFGINLYAAAGAGWLLANAALGVAVIPLAFFIARRYEAKLEGTSPLRALADEIAGRSLMRALDTLDTISRFEEGPP